MNRNPAEQDVDMALAAGAKALHQGRQFMYDIGAAYHARFINPATGLCRDEFLEERRACPVCGSADQRHLFNKGGGSHVLCNACSMVYLAPVFTDDALFDFYTNNNTIQSDVVSNEGNFYSRIYSKGLRTIERHVTGRTILDIGCSSGVFLDIARAAGWETCGIELNQAEAAISARKHTVHQMRLEDLPEDLLFDAITMWDVIEHIKDGAALLQAIQKHLKTDGMFFLQTPSSDSLAARVMQEKCNIYDGIEHVNIYNPRTIRLLAGNNAMTVKHMETVISEIPILVNYLHYQDPYLGETPHHNSVLGLVNENQLHEKLLGYKMQAVLAKDKV